MNSLRFESVVASSYLILSVASACSGGVTATRAPEPAFLGERFPRPHEVVVADSSDTSPITPTPELNYPLDAMSRRIEAAFGTIFVLDTMGRVETPSITFITETPPSFQSSVCDYLRKVRFSPVKRDRQARRAVLVMPWKFGYYGGKLEKIPLDPKPVVNSLRQRGLAAYVPELDTLPHCR